MAYQAVQPPRYTTDNDAVVGNNLPNFSNRPIYCNNSDLYILAGDKPFVHFAKKRRILGALEIGLETSSGLKMIYECEQIKFIYQAGLVRWEISDSSFAGSITLSVGAPENTDAMILRLAASTRVTIVWKYGGLIHIPGTWSIDPFVETEWKSMTFNEAFCEDNLVTLHEDRFSITKDALWDDSARKKVVGKCSAPAYEIKGSPRPYVCGRISDIHEDVYWGFYLEPEEKSVLDLAIDLESAYASVLSRSAFLSGRVVSKTPDPYLDTLLSVVAGEIDGAWYPPVNMHSTLSWNAPFLGWCNRFGNTFCGFHDRALAELTYYAEHQVMDDLKKERMNDLDHKLTVAHPNSRFYGLGHVNQDQYFYDMQSQFFDQAIHAWYSTGDEKLKKVLRPALELHTKWVDDCFDPDQDGIYESYINSWPTDSVWYNGGGSPEETCYALRAHKAAMELAILDNDQDCCETHKIIIERITKGFFDLLWIPDKGHAGKYREQGGHKRLHENPWLYAVFLPIDVGLLDAWQSVQTLYYSKWALENVRLPHGGRKVWISNWVPSIWSVREFTAGENFQLAYAFFKAGFPEEGYDVLKGAMTAAGYDTDFPGGIASEAGSLFYRAVVEGLFGYQPDYPHGKVRLSPQFPADWEHAEVKTADVTLSYKRENHKITLDFTLNKPAEVVVALPVYDRVVLSVRGGNGCEVQPHFGRQILKIEAGMVKAGRIEIETSQLVGLISPITIQAAPLEKVTLTAAGKITALYDPQGITSSRQIVDGRAEIVLAPKSGNHVVFADLDLDGVLIRQIYYLEISKTEEEIRYLSRLNFRIPENPQWHPVELSRYLNADVRDIYKQAYLSPRPATISARIGSDGYSPWTFTFWQNLPPEIDLKHIPALLDEKGELTSPSGVPFTWNAGQKNIAFTSLWDNWPDRVTLPVDVCGQAVWLLLCGTTNPMQCGIANAVVKFAYEDGIEEQLQLINPENFWSLCPLNAQAQKDQGSHTDYSYEFDSFCLPQTPPETLQLGDNCRSIVACFALRKGVQLKSLTLETLSQEVVIGLLGVTILV